jgi:hypothetical protein
VPYGAAEDGRALLGAAREIHAERHGTHTLAPGTRLAFPEAAERAGMRPDRQRYFDALKDLEYEGAIEWDESARYARGDKHYVLTLRGLAAPGRASGEGGPVVLPRTRTAREQGEGGRVPDIRRGGQAQLRAERIGWRARSRSMNRASRILDERLGLMNGGAAALDGRLWHHAEASRLLAPEVGRPHEAGPATPGVIHGGPTRPWRSVATTARRKPATRRYMRRPIGAEKV